jgi:hypothetical protein
VYTGVTLVPGNDLLQDPQKISEYKS